MTEKVILCSGEEMEVFEGDNKRDIQELCRWSKNGFIKPVNGNRLFSTDWLKCDEAMYNFPFRPTDVFINGFPKSGTTWVQEIVWTILFNVDLKHPLQLSNASIRIPLFEGDTIQNVDGAHKFMEYFSEIYGIPNRPPLIEMYNCMPNPRIFKTHIYYTTINKKMLHISKIVYVVRDPMDSCHSFYLYHRYMKGLLGFEKNMLEFADRYIKGQLAYGNSVEHIKDWWPHREHENLHLIFYEQLKNDPAGEIRKLATFLGKYLTDEQTKNIIHQTSFKKMKEVFGETESELFKQMLAGKKEGQFTFCRKGMVGDSKTMPKEAYNKLSAFFKDSLKDFDLPYTFRPLH